jgi:hypothetical protein
MRISCDYHVTHSLWHFFNILNLNPLQAVLDSAAATSSSLIKVQSLDSEVSGLRTNDRSCDMSCDSVVF